MNIKTPILLVLCLAAPFVAISQPKLYPDSIRVEIPSLRSYVVFELKRYKEDKALIADFPGRFDRLLDKVRLSLTEEQLQEPHSVEVVIIEEKGKEDVQQLRIFKPEAPATTVSVVNDKITELLPPGWVVTIADSKSRIYIYAPDFERLSQISSQKLEPVIVRLDSDPDTKPLNRYGLISRMVLQNESVITAPGATHRLPHDMIGLHASAGAGLIYDKLYPEFSVMVALYFSNRFKAHHSRIAVHQEFKLFSGRNAEGRYFTRPARFLSLSYGVNFRKDTPRWTAVGAGFLIRERGDLPELFNGRTMKFFLETDIGSQKLHLIPELYLTEDLKKTFFGLKLDYRF